MNAFVFSGGTNLGAEQAGMLEALFEASVVPDLVVGTSIGAANAAFIAADPTLERARALSALWRRVQARELFPVNPVRLARAALRGGALFSSDPLGNLLRRELGYESIEEARIPLRIVATAFEDGSESIIASGSVVDAVLASTALPGVFPPHELDGRLFLDGGLVDHVPLTPAIDLGADTIYVLSVGFPCPPPADHRSARAVLLHSIGILLSQRVRLDSAHLPQHNPSVRIVNIPPICTQVGLRDFSRSAELIRTAKRQTSAFLAGMPGEGCGHEVASGGTQTVIIGQQGLSPSAA